MIVDKPIVVDLDGTLTLTDTLHESVLVLVRANPFMIALLPFWLMRGVAYLKSKVAERTELNVASLPYNDEFIGWLVEQKRNGKAIVLCTAADERIAIAVSEYVELFDDVIASNAKLNLKGANKRRVLQERYGDEGYDYAGNSTADVEVWKGASHAIVVNAGRKVRNHAERVAPVSASFPSKRPTILDWVKAIRLHQWLKNLLLFVPLLAAHQLDNIQTVITLTIAFVAFGLCASSIYMINDLLDLESDRDHPRKRHRPFASVTLPIAGGVALAPFLMCMSIALGSVVGADFLFVLLLYVILTISYSLRLKRLVIVDCLTLAALYTLRIISGAEAVSLQLSFWLLAFSVFIFLSLAFAKRYAEIVVQSDEGKSAVSGRGYLISDALVLQVMGVSSGYISALVVALYLRSDDVVFLYTEPMVLWFQIPLLLFWISWVWLKAARGQMHDDPIVFAIKDHASLLVVGLSFIMLLCAATGLGM